MRVLTITQEFPPVGGGTAYVSRELAHGLATRGHEVTILTMHMSGCMSHERMGGIRVTRIAHRRLAFRCTVPEMARFVVSALGVVSRDHEYGRASICHAHAIVPSGVIAWYLRRRFGLPYVVTAHGSDVLNYNARFRHLYPLISPVWRSVVRDAAQVTAPSRFLADRIAASGACSPPVLLPNTLDIGRFKPLRKERRILIVGRLTPDKGVEHLLLALAGVGLGSWHIDIAGDGPSRPALESLVSSAGLTSHVTFHGWIPHDSEQMAGLYGHAHLFASASRMENMSLAHLQALSSGCRVVTTAVGGSAELPSCVRLVAPGDIGALRSSIETEMAAYGREEATPCAWVPIDSAETYELLLRRHARKD